MWEKPKLLFKAKAPKENPFQEYIGRMVIIPEFAVLNGKRTLISETKVKIQTIQGNRFKPKFFEINGEHLIGMLRFYAQMNNAKDLTEDQFLAFEEMDIEARKTAPEGSKPGSYVMSKKTNEVQCESYESEPVQNESPYPPDEREPMGTDQLDAEPHPSCGNETIHGDCSDSGSVSQSGAQQLQDFDVTH